MTRSESVNAQTPRAGVNDKRQAAWIEGVRKRKQGEAVDRWRGTRDMRQDSITLGQDKNKVREEEARSDTADGGTKADEDERINVVYVIQRCRTGCI